VLPNDEVATQVLFGVCVRAIVNHAFTAAHLHMRGGVRLLQAVAADDHPGLAQCANVGVPRAPVSGGGLGVGPLCYVAGGFFEYQHELHGISP
jgi:hypothetical protein